MAIKAIETVYRGYRFRSRLEARWAVFFDALGVPYEYEKEGFDLDGAGLYLPDFWLPTVRCRADRETGVWVEIKGQEPTEAENARCHALSAGTGRPVFLFVGLPDAFREPKPVGFGGYEFSPDRGWDNYMRFCQCYSPDCGAVRIEFDEGNYMTCPVCNSSSDYETFGLDRAYAAARRARFEHGETP